MNKVLVVVGPTASGKTKLGVSLAEYLNTEVISADSMQIYKELSISTAKPTVDEMKGIKHYLVDFISINDDYNVSLYVEEAKKIISKLHNVDKIPIIVGGTGLYIDSLINNLEFKDYNVDLRYREELLEKSKNDGIKSLYDLLIKIDPEYAKKVHPNNVRRVIRALELFHSTGINMTQQEFDSKKIGPLYDALFIGLTFKNRELLYNRIDKRIDSMLETGLVDEAKNFYFAYNSGKTSLQAIGCKELFPYFEGSKSLKECVEILKTNSRHYAKRQLTWFNRNENISWFYIDDFETYEELLKNILYKINLWK